MHPNILSSITVFVMELDENKKMKITQEDGRLEDILKEHLGLDHVTLRWEMPPPSTWGLRIKISPPSREEVSPRSYHRGACIYSGLMQFLDEAGVKDQRSRVLLGEYLGKMPDKQMVSTMMAGVRKSQLQGESEKLADLLSAFRVPDFGGFMRGGGNYQGLSKRRQLT